MPLDLSTSVTIAGITCWEEDTEEQFSRRRESQVVRTIVCAWTDRITLTNALLGGSTSNGTFQTFSAASQYPDANWLIVSAVRIEGVGVRSVAASGMVAYQWARLKVTYGRDDADANGEQEVGSIDLDISAEVLSAARDEATFKWSSDDEDVSPEASPGITITTTDFVIPRYNVAGTPVPIVLSLVDHINDGPFQGAVAGHVIYRGARTSKKLTSAGAMNWTLFHRFQHRSKHWNHFLRPSSGVFEKIVYKNGGGDLHAEGNLNALFT